jgi:hypothetical protein
MNTAEINLEECKFTMPTHPKYGEYMERWAPIPGFDMYEVDVNSRVRNKKNGRIFVVKSKPQIKLRRDGKDHQKLTYHLTLMAHFPDVPPLYTVDHIDENNQNHHIENLQWLTRAQNTAKSNKLRPRAAKKVTSKPVLQYELDGTFVQEWPSLIEIERQTGFSCGNISRCIRGEFPRMYGFKWRLKKREGSTNLPEEKWGTNDKIREMLESKGMTSNASKKVKVSNMGRVWNARGRKTYGTKKGREKYREYTGWNVHQLVWAVWGDREPAENEFILHDDSQPLDSDGCCSNAIAHLRLGTQSENIIESHKIGSLSRVTPKKRKRNEM